jgi:hypothetical protein
MPILDEPLGQGHFRKPHFIPVKPFKRLIITVVPRRVRTTFSLCFNDELNSAKFGKNNALNL